MVFLLLSDYWYFSEDFNSVKLFFSSGIIMKKEEGICERGKKSVALVLLHVYLFVEGDDNINVWKKGPPHALMEWDSKEEIKQEKRVFMTEVNFTKKCHAILN